MRDGAQDAPDLPQSSLSRTGPVCPARNEDSLCSVGVKARPRGGGLMRAALTPTPLREEGFPCRMDRTDRPLCRSRRRGAHAGGSGDAQL
jgi:hypothetical protein